MASAGRTLSENSVRNRERLRGLFALQGWRFEESHEDYQDRFDRYCEMLAKLDDEEQELILDLTAEFLHCPQHSYPGCFADVLCKIDPATVTGSTQVLVVPLLRVKHFHKAKSACSLLYNPVAFRLVPEFREKQRQKKIESLLTPGVLGIAPYADRENALILVVDDFVGSGKYAAAALGEYRDKFAKPSDTCIVVALAAQQQGVDAVQALGYEFLTSHVRGRGISDSARLRDPARALSIMDRVEKRIGVPVRYRRGFGKAEALVAMARTPNNTFPVFWYLGDDDDDPWPCPFERF